MQADELRVKTQVGIVWMALALAVSTRLWRGEVVTATRDSHMALQVKACTLCRPLRICFDGFIGYLIAFCQALRSLLVTGRSGRPRLIP